MNSEVLTAAWLHELKAASLQAPSADNSHLFEFKRVSGDICLVAKAPLKDLPPHRQLLCLISAGASSINIELRGMDFGLRLIPNWNSDLTDPLVVRFAIEQIEQRIDPLSAAIQDRHTNRSLWFGNRKLDADAKSQLNEDVSNEQAGLEWLDDSRVRAEALQIIYLAERHRFIDKALHQELFGAIRFDVGWHSKVDDGIAPMTLGLHRVERPMFSALRYWPVQRGLNLLMLDRYLGWRAASLPCRLTPHLGVITAEGDPYKAAVRTGRAMQRVWLRITNLGFSFQLFASPTIYALDCFSPAQQIQSKLAKRWRNICAARPLLVFRTGHI